jgi:DNA-directed RNA polymerase specialized sigma24 family protein
MPVTATLARPEAEGLWADLHGRLRAFVWRPVADPYAADDLAQDKRRT